MRPHGLEHVVRHEHVLFEVAPRLLEPAAHIGVRGEMKDLLGAREHATDPIGIEQASFAQLGRGVQKLPKAARQVVDDTDTSAARHERVHDVTADEAGAARHDHGFCLEAQRHHSAEYHGRRAANNRPAENQLTRDSKRDFKRKMEKHRTKIQEHTQEAQEQVEKAEQRQRNAEEPESPLSDRTE